uniref:ribonuclease H n=1 Tax=Strigamia maritima TaxID=126957 RepID=T1IVU5_STRMM
MCDARCDVRKMMTIDYYYAVTHGRTPGIYNSGKKCDVQTYRYSGNNCKKFITLSKAQSYMKSEIGLIGGPKIYIKGACHSTRAGIGVYWGKHNTKNVGESLLDCLTNNRAEIRAAVRAIRQAKDEGLVEITIMTDSEFLVKSVVEWLEMDGWKTVTGEAVEYWADLEDAIDASRGIIVNWRYVPHNSKGNNAADKLACQGILK